MSRLTGINRATVYAVGKTLLKKGIIREETGKTTYFVARSPEDLSRLLEREQEKLRQQEHVLRQAIDAVKPLMHQAGYAVPSVRFIDEEGLERFLYHQHRTWVESIERYDGIWHGYQDHSFVEHYEEWIVWSWKQPFARKLELQLFTNKSQVEEHAQLKSILRRHITFWPHGDDITATTWVNGDYVVLITTRQRPHYAVEIHDAQLGASMRAMFRALWKGM